MRKPDSCIPCKLYQDGDGYVPDELIEGAPVTIFLQNPGTHEVKGEKIVEYVSQGKGRRPLPMVEQVGPRPAIGPTGYELDRNYLPLAGLERGKNVSLCNIIKCRWNHSNELPEGQLLKDAAAYCVSTHLKVPASTEVIVAHGKLAWETLEERRYSITDWRGFIGPRPYQGKPVYGTLHTADLFRDRIARTYAREDWNRLRRYRQGAWPRPIPPRTVLVTGATESAFLAAESWFKQAAAQCKFVALDTEFVPGTTLLTILSVGGRMANGQIDGVQIQWTDVPQRGRAIVAQGLRMLLQTVPVTFWNAMADLPQLERFGLHHGIFSSNYKQVEDTMQAHAVSWAELAHTLDFAASVDGQHTKLKHLEHSDPLLYNWGDTIETICCHEERLIEFQSDPQAESVYRTQNLPLIPVVMETEQAGVRINVPKAKELHAFYSTRLREWNALARGILGWPINIGSGEQVKAYASERHDLELVSTEKDVISEARMNVLAFDAEYEQKQGLSPEYVLQRIENGAYPILELRAGYMRDMKVKTGYLDTLLRPDGSILERVFPEFLFHTQANARWSIKKPALETLPLKLRSLYIPDEGDVFLGWDYDQIELRILAALSGDEPLLHAFRMGWDVHTMNTCDIFGLPYPPNLKDPNESADNAAWRKQVNWGGKDDKRRVFSKRFVYRLNYGGDPRYADTIPGAKELGLTKGQLVSCSYRFLAAHPTLAKWRRATEELASKSGIARDFMGRPRRLLEGGQAAIRAAFDYPMQAGVQSIANHVILEIRKTVSGIKRYVYGMHDSQWWAVKRTAAEGIKPYIKAIAEKQWNVGGVITSFPASFKWMDEQGVEHKWSEAIA